MAVYCEASSWTHLYGDNINTLRVKWTVSTRASSEGRFYKAALEEDGQALASAFVLDTNALEKVDPIPVPKFADILSALLAELDTL